jgi:hypothetical protein
MLALMQNERFNHCITSHHSSVTSFGTISSLSGARWVDVTHRLQYLYFYMSLLICCDWRADNSCFSFEVIQVLYANDVWKQANQRGAHK